MIKHKCAVCRTLGRSALAEFFNGIESVCMPCAEGYKYTPREVDGVPVSIPRITVTAPNGKRVDIPVPSGHAHRVRLYEFLWDKDCYCEPPPDLEWKGLVDLVGNIKHKPRVARDKRARRHSISNKWAGLE